MDEFFAFGRTRHHSLSPEFETLMQASYCTVIVRTVAKGAPRPEYVSLANIHFPGTEVSAQLKDGAPISSEVFRSVEISKLLYSWPRQPFVQLTFGSKAK